MNLQTLHFRALQDAQREEDERFMKILIYKIHCNHPPDWWDGETCRTRTPHKAMREAIEWHEGQANDESLSRLKFTITTERMTLREWCDIKREVVG